MDIIMAFLNGTLIDEVFMEIPEGFQGAGDPSKVCHLKWALYGLRQAPQVWYNKIDSWLQHQNLKRSTSNPNLYYSVENGKYTTTLIYVDDMLLTRNNDLKIQAL